MPGPADIETGGIPEVYLEAFLRFLNTEPRATIYLPEGLPSAGAAEWPIGVQESPVIQSFQEIRSQEVLSGANIRGVYVAMLSDGSSLITWEENGQVYLKQTTADGEDKFSFPIGTREPRLAINPRLVVNANGSEAAVVRQGGLEGYYATIVDAEGNVVAEFTVTDVFSSAEVLGTSLYYRYGQRYTLGAEGGGYSLIVKQIVRGDGRLIGARFDNRGKESVILEPIPDTPGDEQLLTGVGDLLLFTGTGKLNDDTTSGIFGLRRTDKGWVEPQLLVPRYLEDENGEIVPQPTDYFVATGAQGQITIVSADIFTGQAMATRLVGDKQETIQGPNERVWVFDAFSIGADDFIVSVQQGKLVIRHIQGNGNWPIVFQSPGNMFYDYRYHPNDENPYRPKAITVATDEQGETTVYLGYYQPDEKHGLRYVILTINLIKKGQTANPTVELGSS